MHPPRAGLFLDVVKASVDDRVERVKFALDPAIGRATAARSAAPPAALPIITPVSVATVVSTRPLAPLIAVAVIAFGMVAIAVIAVAVTNGGRGGSRSGTVLAGGPRSTPAAAVSTAWRSRSQRARRRLRQGVPAG
ncbi:MAG: hypothetical protein JO213_05755 [Alphaproteobacteria bacterium]|nr:hypothetical protein [Alphaproteobacteria bacterium]MBV9967770.1 hypothetical protein [Alphaproteobacteria bacterium]